jgi:hypothetical protein
MGTAYTPGLRVSANTVVRKQRRLPLKGTVPVKVGDEVAPDTVVARTELPGTMMTVKVAELLGLEPNEVKDALKKDVGDSVTKDEVLAEHRSFFGLFRSEARAPVNGVIELISPVSGHVGVREHPTPIEVTAYVRGKVAEVIPEEGVVVETQGAMIQGIFGVGGERLGELHLVAKTPSEKLTEDVLTPNMKGKIVVGGSNVSGGALRRASELGIIGIVVGGIIDKDLLELLGYDIGVAITGHEDINLTVIVTEGFGVINMAERTFELLKSLDGKMASINGATQIRAGVIRPEIVVPLLDDRETAAESVADEQTLEIGTNIRIIREPYFGMLGNVTKLPPELTVIDSGAKVRILEAKLVDGREATVPRANVEIIAQ